VIGGEARGHTTTALTPRPEVPQSVKDVRGLATVRTFGLHSATDVHRPSPAADATSSALRGAGLCRVTVCHYANREAVCGDGEG